MVEIDKELTENSEPGGLCRQLREDLEDEIVRVMENSQEARQEVGFYAYKQDGAWKTTMKVSGGARQIGTDEIAKAAADIPDGEFSSVTIHTHPLSTNGLSPQDLVAFSDFIHDDDGIFVIEQSGDKIILSGLEKTKQAFPTSTVEFRGGIRSLKEAVTAQMGLMTEGVLSPSETLRRQHEILSEFTRECQTIIEV